MPSTSWLAAPGLRSPPPSCRRVCTPRTLAGPPAGRLPGPCSGPRLGGARGRSSQVEAGERQPHPPDSLDPRRPYKNPHHTGPGVDRGALRPPAGPLRDRCTLRPYCITAGPRPSETGCIPDPPEQRSASHPPPHPRPRRGSHPGPALAPAHARLVRQPRLARGPSWPARGLGTSLIPAGPRA